jgi:GDP-L-fucose synthase
MKYMSIKELVKIIIDIIGYKGKIDYDTKKPDGIKKKPLDIKLQKKFDFKPLVGIEEGLNKMYQDYCITINI